MIEVFRQLTSLFVDKPIDHPFTPTVKAKVTTPAEPKPDNLVYSAGRAFVRTETESGFEEEIWSGASGQRSEKLTPDDMTIIAERRLKETKYVKLKPYWAAEYSAAQVAREFRGQRGFSQRTIEQYWAAMNAAFTPSPAIR